MRGSLRVFYLGEDGGPDGLNLLDLGSGQKGLDLVGLYRTMGVSHCEISVCCVDSMFRHCCPSLRHDFSKEILVQASLQMLHELK